MMPRSTIVLALVAVFGAVTAIGAGGIIVGAGAVSVTMFVAEGLDARTRWRRLLVALLAGVGILLGIVFLPVVSGITHAGRVMRCNWNLREIGLGFHNYHAKWESFPPAYFADAAGQPAHSWRVLLFPLVSPESLSFKYDFDEPWNGPNNSEGMSRESDHIAAIYRCPSWSARNSEGALLTRYFAVVGENTVWPGAESRSFADIAHPSRTILLVECFDREIPWLEPRDILLDEATAAQPVKVSLLGWWLRLNPRGSQLSRSREGAGEYHRYIGRNALFVDGSVRLLPTDLSAADLRALADIRDVPKPVLAQPPQHGEPIPDVIKRLPFAPAGIRWTGLGLFLMALATIAISTIPPSTLKNLPCDRSSCFS
jgi:prepilin-type processing-associated H-X9-DG protein